MAQVMGSLLVDLMEGIRWNLGLPLRKFFQETSLEGFSVAPWGEMLDCNCKRNKRALTWKPLLCKEESNISPSVRCQPDITVSEMAARRRRKAASGATRCNYGPAENPVRPPTSLELTRCCFQPFERIPLSGRGRSIPGFCRLINTCLFLRMRHGTPGRE